MSIVVEEIVTQLREVDITSNKENEQKENNSEKSDKKKGKNKKKSKAPVKIQEEESAVVLKEVDENQPPAPVEVGPVCAFCKKSEPSKRCSKRHQKCLAKMFCNETCESLAHDDKKSALVKKEANKVLAKKKNAHKVKNWKNTDSGQFWWHDQ